MCIDDMNKKMEIFRKKSKIEIQFYIKLQQSNYVILTHLKDHGTFLQLQAKNLL